MKIGLVFTNDWELFGDGSGDYFEVQHNPLKDMLKVFDRYNAKLSIMAETYQQIKHREHIESNSKFGEIVESWERILQESYKKGHDVQLHIHPQWKESNYSNGEWELGTNWSIGKRDKNEIFEIVNQCSNYLKSVIQEVDSDYNCQVYRAGAYYIEPSENVIKVLKKLNFICDTSVTKGTYVDEYYNYKDANSNIIPWTIGERGVKYVDNTSEFVELPIYSKISIDSEGIKKFFPKVYYKLKFGVNVSDEELEWMKERDKVKSIRYPSSRRAYKKHENKNLAWYFDKILSKNAIQLDYDYIPSSAFVKIIENILNNKELEKYSILPVVASGHVKDMHNTKNIEKILDELTSKFPNQIEFWNISDAAKFTQNNLIRN